MAITLKKGLMKYKDPTTGNYIEFNAVAQATTAAEIEEIQGEGDTQIAAVQAKGTEVIESIPEDYTELDGEVTSLKSALGKDEITSLLLADPIPDTVQAITFDTSGNVQTITHSRDGAAVRTDAFAFADGSITETRTLATGESLTIVTNTDTLVTTSTYAEETA